MDPNILPRFSKSSVGGANFCVQQYFIRYVLGVKEPETDDMIRGTNVHNIVEDFYRAVDMEPVREIMSLSTIAKVKVDRVHDYFMSLVPTLEHYQDNYALDEDEHIRKFLLIEALRSWDSNLDNYLPIGNEITLHGVVELDDQMVHITGMIDRLFVNERGEYHVHELKTGAFKDKKLKWKSMREELAYYVFLMKNCDDKLYDRKNNVIGEMNLREANVAWWGWDHTGGKGVYRGKEPCRAKEMGSMLRSMSDLLRYHRNYRGDTDGLQFPLLEQSKTPYICEPWCRVKGFCPRYERVLMPYDARMLKSKSGDEGE